MGIPNIRPHILSLTILILISYSQSLSPATAPTHSPASAPKRTRAHAHAPPLPPAISPTLPLPPSPAFTGPDCTTSFLNLTSCLTFVQQGANLTLPEKGCCPSLAGLVDSNPVCLCQLLSTSNTFGIKIDVTKALILPTVCHVQTPPVSLCNDLGIPVASPGPLSPAAAGGGAAAPSGTDTLAPATSIAAAPSSSDGRLTARVTYMLLALLTIIGQVIFVFL